MDAQSAARTAAWYATPAGCRAAALVRAAVRPVLLTGASTRLLAIGAGPLLDGFDRATVERIAVVGAVTAPGTVVADPAKLPFVEAMFDTVLVAHALETADSPRKLLRELWRVLAPAGEAVLVVPNRASAWSLTEATPFGEGRAYGAGGLTRALDAAMFEVVDRRMALFAPPWRGAGWSETLLAHVASRLGGVHVVRVRKRDGLAPLPSRGVRVRRTVQA